MGPLFMENVPVVTGNDYHSLMAAFNKRCNYHTDEEMAPKDLKLVYELIGDIGKFCFEDFDYNEEIFDDWIGKFDPVKQKRMRDALWACCEMTENRFTSKDLFVKVETLLKRGDPTWAPRVIYQGSDGYNVITGPIMHVLMKRLVAACDCLEMSGLKFLIAYAKLDTEIAAFLDECRVPEGYEGDFSSNDKTQIGCWVTVVSHLMTTLGAPSWFTTLYRKTQHFKVYNREYGLSATIRNQLATGGTDTTFRNCFINMAILYITCKPRRIRGRAVLLGDDNFFLPYAPFFIEWWVASASRVGQKLVASARKLQAEASFLSRFIAVNCHVPCMMPLLGKALMRFNARANQNDDISDSRYMAGKSLSYAYEFRHAPIVRDFFLERYTSEDYEDVEVQDLGWFSRLNNVEPGLVAKMIFEAAELNEDEFGDVIMDRYLLGISDIVDLCRTVIIEKRPLFIEDQRYFLLAKEVE